MISEGEEMTKDILETEKLLLRPITLDDAQAMFAYGGNPENVRYMAWGPNTMEQTIDFIKKSKSGEEFAIVLKSENVVIGSCGVYPDENNDTGELGWILHKNYWKHGYGTEFARELIRYGFEDLGLRRLTATCVAENYGSYRIMERNGMRREALHVKAHWSNVDKVWYDSAVYAILAEEYFK